MGRPPPRLRAATSRSTGAELVDGGSCYRVVPVEPAPNPQAFGHVWAELID